MSPLLPVLSGASVVRALVSVGFAQISQRGNHVKLRRDRLTVIVPLHRELALRSILRQAEMTPEEFIKLV